MHRFISFFLVITFIFVLAIPCFASNSFNFSFPSDFFFSFAPSPGIYNFDFTFFNTNVNGLTTVYSGVFDGLGVPISCTYCTISSFDSDIEDALTFYFIQDPESDPSSPALFIFVADYKGDFFTSSDFSGSLFLDKVINKDFVTSVSDGLLSSISWLGLSANSLFFGILNPLLILFFISLAIALLYFTIKFIYSILR